MATNSQLAGMKLPELRDIAKQMGLRGTSTMRKPELLATLEAARNGGEAPAGVTVKLPSASSHAASSRASQSDKGISIELPARKTPVLSSNIDEEESTSYRAHRAQYAHSDHTSSRAYADNSNSYRERNDRDRSERSERTDSSDFGIKLPPRVHRPVENLSATEEAEREANRHQVKVDLDNILSALPDRSERERAIAIANSAEQRAQRSYVSPERRNRENPRAHNLDDDFIQLPTQDSTSRDRRNSDGAALGRLEDLDIPERPRVRNADSDDRAERIAAVRADRAERVERAERARAAQEVDVDETTESGEELVPVAGIVDILDSYAFVRTSGYLPGPSDVYVSMGQVKKYGLRKGDAVRGYIRASRDSDRRNQRQKFVPLQSIETINGMSLDEAATRPQFAKLTPLYPQERLKMETTPANMTGRIIDIVSPIGKGQRGLIVSPPKAGKTITLQNIANSITANNPEVHLMVVLVDERPEEVTDMERTVQGEIIASTFDRPATDHTIVAELAIERAKRLVELGQDVVVLLDSMTRLARAYNIAAPASGRILSGGVDAQALYPPKKFFGAARNIENGGSLTIISSALVETGSKMDEVIFEEFKGTGNMELRLSRDLSEKRLFPAIDINASSTRREELITDPQMMAIIYRLRRALGGLEPEAAYQQLVGRLKKTNTNRDFMIAMSQGN